MTWEVEGVILFLRNLLPPLGYASHITTYVINEQTLNRFERNLIASIVTNFQKGKVTQIQRLNNELATPAKETYHVEKEVDKLQEAITTACNNSFTNAETNQKWTKYKAVPWWTQEITIKRKSLNALRRLYQRMRTAEQRESRKKIYHEEKARHQAAIKNEKLKSWKEYCYLTPGKNPWNTVYKIATNKYKSVMRMTSF